MSAPRHELYIQSLNESRLCNRKAYLRHGRSAQHHSVAALHSLGHGVGVGGGALNDLLRSCARLLERLVRLFAPNKANLKHEQEVSVKEQRECWFRITHSWEVLG